MNETKPRTAEDYLAALHPNDKIALQSALRNWRNDGQANPLIPIADGDVTGDGIVDSWGLDENDRLTVVPGAPLDDTVFVTKPAAEKG